MNFLTTIITIVPIAAVRRGETLESLNAKRDAARILTRRVLQTQNRCGPDDLDKLEAAEAKADAAFDAFHLAYYGRPMKKFNQSGTVAHYA